MPGDGRRGQHPSPRRARSPPTWVGPVRISQDARKRAGARVRRPVSLRPPDQEAGIEIAARSPHTATPHWLHGRRIGAAMPVGLTRQHRRLTATGCHPAGPYDVLPVLIAFQASSVGAFPDEDEAHGVETGPVDHAGEPDLLAPVEFGQPARAPLEVGGIGGGCDGAAVSCGILTGHQQHLPSRAR